MIKRYKISENSDRLVEYKYGLIALYSDHQAEIDRLKGLLRNCESFIDMDMFTVSPNDWTESKEALLKQIKEACSE